jgi:protein-tyrosine-phosphatase
MPATTAPDRQAWGFALGYFAFYIPYSALTKVLSQGLLSGTGEPVPGFVLLPATAVATTAGMLATITVAGGWGHLRRRRLAGLAVPLPRLSTSLSGLATAAIIATTTLNYTFGGISIILALLLMRGGVLILAPIVDLAFGRRIGRESWAAFGLSLAAILVALSEVDGYRMTAAAALIVGTYLAGYVVRITLMTSVAKSPDPATNRRFYFEESAVAAVALTAAPAAAAVLGWGGVGGQLREGFTTFLATPMVGPALAIGLLYSCLYIFGTAIYLGGRENTFCIPLNRCSSLLSGLVASYGLVALFGLKPPSAYQLVGAAIIAVALVLMMLASRSAGLTRAQRIYLFVCAGNTSRSPMAQAICNDEVARLFGLGRSGPPVVALSAGLTAQPGRPLTELARSTLTRLGVAPHEHASRPVTAELMACADRVFCMTEAQRAALAERFPEAASKVHRLDPDADLPDPSGQDSTAYQSLAERLQALVRLQLERLSFDPAA